MVNSVMRGCCLYRNNQLQPQLLYDHENEPYPCTSSQLMIPPPRPNNITPIRKSILTHQLKMTTIKISIYEVLQQSKVYRGP